MLSDLRQKRKELLLTFNKKIIIEKYSTTQNENGFDEESWSEYFNCWAMFRNISGKEYISAKANNSENIVTFTVRYCSKLEVLLNPGASKEFRIKYNNNIYDIEYPGDYNDMHKFIDIKCTIRS